MFNRLTFKLRHYPTIVIAGPLPCETTMQQLLENKLCQWDPDGEATLIVPALGILVEQDGKDITVSSIADCEYGYSIIVAEEANARAALKGSLSLRN